MISVSVWPEVPKTNKLWRFGYVNNLYILDVYISE